MVLRVGRGAVGAVGMIGAIGATISCANALVDIAPVDIAHSSSAARKVVPCGETRGSGRVRENA